MPRDFNTPEPIKVEAMRPAIESAWGPQMLAHYDLPSGDIAPEKRFLRFF